MKNSETHAGSQEIFTAARRAICPGIIERFFSTPGAHWKNGEFWCLNPLRPDKNINSFSINESGQYFDFASNQKGDIITLLSEVQSITLADAARKIIEAAGGEAPGAPAPEKRGESLTIPEDRLPELEAVAKGAYWQEKHGSLTKIWPYRDQAGIILYCVLRWDGANGKVVRPFHLTSRGFIPGQPLENGRPLYRLPDVINNPNKPVILVEGEPAADAAGEKLPDFVSTTWTGGCAALHRTDFSPLKGRRVYVMGDADKPGQTAVAELRRYYLREAAELFLVHPREGAVQGEDAADLDAETLRRMVESAELVTASDSNDSKNGKSQEKTPRAPKKQSDQIIETVIAAGAQLTHWQREPFITVLNDAGGLETSPLYSRAARLNIGRLFYASTKTAVSERSLQEAQGVLAALAIYQGESVTVSLRVAGAPDRIVIDTGRPSGERVVITAGGVEITTSSPERFIRPMGMMELPLPEPGGSFDELADVANLGGDENLILLHGQCLQAIRPAGPYITAIIEGQQGSGKSFTCRLLRDLLDPNKAPLRSLPGNELDLITAATSSFLLMFDNASRVSPDMADALARLATGGGFGKRELYSDFDEKLFEGARPIVINGINIPSDRPDLLDRSMIISLPRCAERSTERELLEKFEIIRPRVLGALYSEASAAIREGLDTTNGDLPRMADAAAFIIAAERGSGSPERFLVAFRMNQAEAVGSTLDSVVFADPLLDVLRKHAGQDEWMTTTTELLEEINITAGDDQKRRKSWPKNAGWLSRDLRRAVPAFRERYGIEIEFPRKTGGGRCVFFQNLSYMPSLLSLAVTK